MRVEVSDENRLATMDDIRALAAAINANAIVASSGLDVREFSGGTAISLANQNNIRIGRVSTSEAITDYKWKYTLTSVKQMANASDRTSSVWIDLDGSSFEAYNLIEDMNINSSTGVENIIGTGVDVSDTGSLPSTMTPQPVPVGCLLMCFKMGSVWWFAYENGIDGSC